MTNNIVLLDNHVENWNIRKESPNGNVPIILLGY